jgi:DHA1 family tetracycline resistance protein-like MFS transporter
MRRSSLAIVYLTVFIDLLGVGIILPVLPFYAQNFGASGLAVGATLALYSAMQLVSSPLLGALSDRVGRRPVLLVSLAGSAISLALTGLAGSLPVLLLTRALAGLFGGAIGTAQAYVADVTPPAERARAMGLIGAMTGLGFIFGPALGASLSQFGLGTAAFVAAGLAAGNFLLAWFFLPESRPAGIAPRRPMFAFLRVGEALVHPAVGRLFGAMFLAMFAFAGVQATFPLLGIQNFALTASSLGVVFVTVGAGLSADARPSGRTAHQPVRGTHTGTRGARDLCHHFAAPPPCPQPDCGVGSAGLAVSRECPLHPRAHELDLAGSPA